MLIARDVSSLIDQTVDRLRGGDVFEKESTKALAPGVESSQIVERTGQCQDLIERERRRQGWTARTSTTVPEGASLVLRVGSTVT